MQHLSVTDKTDYTYSIPYVFVDKVHQTDSNMETAMYRRLIATSL